MSGEEKRESEENAESKGNSRGQDSEREREASVPSGARACGSRVHHFLIQSERLDSEQ